MTSTPSPSPLINQKNYSIDGLKALLAILIVAYHTAINFYGQQAIFKYLSAGYLAVDGFFVISGFLLAGSIERRTQRQEGLCFARFIKDRYLRLFPEYFFVLLATLIISAILHERINHYLIIPNLLFLANINGFGSIVRDAWFISTLFWVSIFFFGCFKLFKTQVALFIIATLSFISISALSIYNCGIAVHSVPMIGFFSAGVLRTVYGLGIGILLFKIKDGALRNFSSRIALVLEILSLIICLIYIGHDRIGILGAFFVVPFSYILLRLFYANSFLVSLLNSRPLQAIAPSSYMLFLCHLIIVERLSRYLRETVLSINPYIAMMAIILASILTSIIFHKLSQALWAFLSTIFNQQTKQ